MLFLIVITTHLGEILDTSTVVRENYGVVFAPKSILDNTHSVWHHTFAFELPDIEQPCSKDEFDDGALSASAERRGFFIQQDFCPAFNTDNERNSRIKEDIESPQRQLNLLMSPNDNFRNKRGLFDIVGKVSKSLFGTATTEDAQILANHIKQIEKKEAISQSYFEVIQDNLQSFMIKSTARADLLDRTIKMNMEYINETRIRTRAQTEELSIQLKQWINILHVYGTQYADTLSDIRFNLNEELHALQTLLEGFLPVYFAPPAKLASVLDNIKHDLIIGDYFYI